VTKLDTRKLALLVGGASAAVTMVVMGTGQANAEVPDVTGEQYGRAIAVLKNLGYKGTFGGAIGNDLPQSQCVVIEQQPAGRTVKLRLNCDLAPGQEQPVAPNTHSLVPPGGSVPQTGTSGAPAPVDPGRPTPGAGTVTVTPRQVG
jgi:beta-lactam-binding protein with PASTA domain